MMNWKEFGSGHGKNEVCATICMEGLRKTMGRLSLDSEPAKIQTKLIANTSVDQLIAFYGCC
jgi:hypothetical protein